MHTSAYIQPAPHIHSHNFHVPTVDRNAATGNAVCAYPPFNTHTHTTPRSQQPTAPLQPNDTATAPIHRFGASTRTCAIKFSMYRSPIDKADSIAGLQPPFCARACYVEGHQRRTTNVTLQGQFHFHTASIMPAIELSDLRMYSRQ